MNELTVELNKFQPRPYQLDFLHAFERDNYQKLLIIWPRRAGKDFTVWNALLRAALKRVATYYIVYPTHSQGRKILWEGKTNNGERFLDFIPQQLIAKTNEQMMRINLINGSIIQVVGSKSYDNLVGVNLGGAVFSEYALQDYRCYQYLRPILLANMGFAIFISTPRGKNSLYELYQRALKANDWWVSHLTIEDTKHVTKEEIEKEIADGEISWDMAQQEWYCSFSMGVEGAFYNKYIDTARLEDRITQVPWDAQYPVHTAWDLGPSKDDTAIIFFQCVGPTIRIIDCYSNKRQGFEHYANYLNSKPYTYGKHIAPFDIAVFEMGTGLTRYERAKSLGINFTVAPAPIKVNRQDGIEAVRALLNRVWFDERKAAPLIKALENYRQEWDHTKQVYKLNPLHDWSSHYADAMRYLAISIKKLQTGMTQEDIDRKFKEVHYGQDIPRPFQQPNPLQYMR